MGQAGSQAVTRDMRPLTYIWKLSNWLKMAVMNCTFSILFQYVGWVCLVHYRRDSNLPFYCKCNEVIFTKTWNIPGIRIIPRYQLLEKHCGSVNCSAGGCTWRTNTLTVWMTSNILIKGVINIIKKKYDISSYPFKNRSYLWKYFIWQQVTSWHERISSVKP
jgi:hypothetical protein